MNLAKSSSVGKVPQKVSFIRGPGEWPLTLESNLKNAKCI